MADVSVGIEELVDQFAALGRLHRADELAGLVGGRDAPGDIEVGAAHEGAVPGERVRFDLIGRVVLLDEGIDPSGGAAGVGGLCDAQ